MAEVTVLSGIVASDAVIAEPVTFNFSAIQTALNSNALNSLNYKSSGVASNNIITNAILSQHVTVSDIPQAKIAAGAVLHSNLNFANSNACSMLRIGAASSNMPVNGVRVANITFTAVGNTDGDWFSFSAPWSSAVYGDPSFTSTPNVIGFPGCIVTSGTDSYGLDVIRIQSCNSTGITCFCVMTDIDETVTVNINAVGPV